MTETQSTPVGILAGQSAGVASVNPAELARVDWLEEVLPDSADQRDYAREQCAVVLTEAMGEAMERANLTRVAVAERLGHHKSFVTRALSARQNITLKTLSDLLWACGFEVVGLDVAPLGESLLSHSEAERFYADVLTAPSQVSRGKWRLDSEAFASCAQGARQSASARTAPNAVEASAEVAATNESLAFAA